MSVRDNKNLALTMRTRIRIFIRIFFFLSTSLARWKRGLWRNGVPDGCQDHFRPAPALRGRRHRNTKCASQRREHGHFSWRALAPGTPYFSLHYLWLPTSSLEIHTPFITTASSSRSLILSRGEKSKTILLIPLPLSRCDQA